ncbi:hypothetical protein CsSME_00024775 [Camellia sinensis var. sinensis]
MEEANYVLRVKNLGHRSKRLLALTRALRQMRK